MKQDECPLLITTIVERVPNSTYTPMVSIVSVNKKKKKKKKKSATST